MSIHTLPDEPAYTFCPAGNSHDGPFQIRIAVEDMAVSIPTSLVAVSLDDAPEPPGPVGCLRLASCRRHPPNHTPSAVPGHRVRGKLPSTD